jgi:class 3 adenylate cyclase
LILPYADPVQRYIDLTVSILIVMFELGIAVDIIIRIIDTERRKNETLLHAILPEETAAELIDTGKTEPRYHEQTSILFADLVGFTPLAAELDPVFLIAELNDIYSEFDRIVQQNGCERVKTIGDSYMAIGGVPSADVEHARAIVQSAVEMLNYLQDRGTGREPKWRARFGIHSGPVVAGVVGVERFQYDVFGDTVNVASRMENSADPMTINISEQTAALVQASVDLIDRGEFSVRGIGRMRMYYVDTDSDQKPLG